MGFALFITTVFLRQLYPLIWIGGREIRSFSCLEAVELLTACASTVLIPLLTPIIMRFLRTAAHIRQRPVLPCHDGGCTPGSTLLSVRVTPTTENWT